MLIQFDNTNFKDILPERKWSIYNEYRRIGSWTCGSYEAMLYDDIKDIIQPISDDACGERNCVSPFDYDDEYERF